MRPSALLVGISNPATLPRLVQVAAWLAELTGCGVHAVHVVTLPPHLPLGAARSTPELQRGRDLLEEAVGVAREAGLTLAGSVVVGREVGESLVSAAAQHGTDAILIGYAGVGRDEKAFDRIALRVARHSPADLLVAKFRTAQVRRLLVPVAGPPHLALTATVARAVATGTGAEARFLHVAPSADKLSKHRERIAALLAEHGLRDLGPLDMRASLDPVAAVVEASRDYDMAVIGASARPGLSHTIFSSRSEQIAAQTTASVLLVRTA